MKRGDLPVNGLHVDLRAQTNGLSKNFKFPQLRLYGSLPRVERPE